MSEEKGQYQTRPACIGISDAQNAIAELSAYYAQIPEDLLASGKPAAVVVYGMLDRIAHEGTGWASVEAIAERTHLGTATVQRARAWLIENGWLVILRRGRNGMASDYQLPWRSKRQNIKVISLTNQSDTVEQIKVIQHPEPLTEPLTEPLSQYIGNGAKNADNSDQEVWPDWYSTLYAIPGFTILLAAARAWLTKADIPESHAETTAYALKSKWPGNPKSPYRDPWATFQNWVKQPPLASAAPRAGTTQTGPPKPQERLPDGSLPPTPAEEKRIAEFTRYAGELKTRRAAFAAQREPVP